MPRSKAVTPARTPLSSQRAPCTEPHSALSWTVSSRRLGQPGQHGLGNAGRVHLVRAALDALAQLVHPASAPGQAARGREAELDCGLVLAGQRPLVVLGVEIRSASEGAMC